MESRAINGRWPMSEKQRRRVVVRLSKIIEDPDTKTREVTAAARALIAADGLNVAEEKANDGFTQDELLARWNAAVQAAVEAELKSRGISGGQSSKAGDGILAIGASTVSEATAIPGPA